MCIHCNQSLKVICYIGCIYINNVNLITTETVLNENEIPLIIDESFDIDIDTPEDFIRAERKIKGE